MYVRLGDLEVPRILLGTSPFIGAGQFGARAWLYYARFVGKPEKVAEIIKYSVELGVRGVQVLAYDYIVEAVRRVVAETGEDLFVAGTVMPENPEESLELLSGIGCKIGLVHGALVSRRNIAEVKRQVKMIEEYGMKPGVALHSIPALKPVLEECPEIEVVMAPVNVKGIFMGDREESLRILEESDRFVIAKKVLGAGRIEPRTALKYVYSLPFVKSVAVGVASKEEARETFTIAFDILE